MKILSFNGFLNETTSGKKTFTPDEISKIKKWLASVENFINFVIERTEKGDEPSSYTETEERLSFMILGKKSNFEYPLYLGDNYSSPFPNKEDFSPDDDRICVSWYLNLLNHDRHREAASLKHPEKNGKLSNSDYDMEEDESNTWGTYVDPDVEKKMLDFYEIVLANHKALGKNLIDKIGEEIRLLPEEEKEDEKLREAGFGEYDGSISLDKEGIKRLKDFFENSIFPSEKLTWHTARRYGV
jgi:hypothetical protein